VVNKRGLPCKNAGGNDDLWTRKAPWLDCIWNSDSLADGACGSCLHRHGANPEGVGQAPDEGFPPSAGFGRVHLSAQRFRRQPGAVAEPGPARGRSRPPGSYRRTGHPVPLEGPEDTLEVSHRGTVHVRGGLQRRPPGLPGCSGCGQGEHRQLQAKLRPVGVLRGPVPGAPVLPLRQAEPLLGGDRRVSASGQHQPPG